jgi:hypothetical protein
MDQEGLVVVVADAERKQEPRRDVKAAAYRPDQLAAGDFGRRSHDSPFRFGRSCRVAEDLREEGVAFVREEAGGDSEA